MRQMALVAMALGATISTVASAGGIKTDGSVEADGPLVSNLADGPPLDVSSSDLVANLNADYVDGFEASQFAQSTHDHGASYQPAYRRTVVVGPTPGDPRASGAALLSALAGITDASAENPYLLKIEPGLYDLAEDHLAMKPWVDVEGSGELVTKITSVAFAHDFRYFTVYGANDCELQFLTVEHIGEENHSSGAVMNEATSTRLLHVTAVASGGGVDNIPIWNKDNSTAYLSHVRAEGIGGEYAWGVLNEGAPTLRNVSAMARDGGINWAIYNNGLPAVEAAPLLVDVTAVGKGGDEAYGVINERAEPTIQGGSFLALDGTVSYGMFNQSHGQSGPWKVTAHHSTLAGETATILSESGFSTYILGSKLEGGAVDPGAGTVVCAAVVDEGYTFYDTTCP